MSDEPTSFELHLDRGTKDDYVARLRVLRPGAETEDRLEVGDLRLDQDVIDEHEYDTDAYGRALSDFLFGHPGLNGAFENARGSASRLRLRLSIGSSASELHALRWETLTDPAPPHARLLHDPAILFSR